MLPDVSNQRCVKIEHNKINALSLPFKSLPSSSFWQALPQQVRSNHSFYQLLPQHSVGNDAIPRATNLLSGTQRLCVQERQNVLRNMVQSTSCRPDNSIFQYLTALN